VDPGPAAHKRGAGPVILTIALVAAIVATVLWVEAPVIWPAKSGPPVELLGINRTVSYSGGNSGYVNGTTTAGCPACPVVLRAGTTVAVNVSWLSVNPDASGLHFTFVNLTIRSPYPFLGASGSGSDRPTVYSFQNSWEAGGPGGSWGIFLSFDIPRDPSELPPTGWVTVWVNASAY